MSAPTWSARSADYAASEPHKFGPSLPKLLSLARPSASDILLDVGTGAGHTAAAFAPFVKKVYGLDPAEGMLAAAREMYGYLDNLEFIPGTGDDTGFPDNTFDLITARHTLHHHESVPDTLKELERVLKPGGRLVIVDEVTPTKSSRRGITRSKRSATPPTCALTSWTSGGRLWGRRGSSGSSATPTPSILWTLEAG